MIAFTKAWFAGGLLALASLPAHAVQESTGTTPGGAAYRIAVPDAWQPGDGLVLIQHGFSFAPVTDPTLGPLRDRMLADGYAVAASGYRQRGWALFTARDDNVELLDVFRARHGEPGHLVAAGGSMGGLVSLKLAEDPRLRERTAGVLAFCPAADGVAAWDTAFDLRLAYDAICAPAAGGDLPRGAEPTPWALDLAQLPPDVENPEDSDALLVAASGIARCTGLGIPEPLRTGGMRERLAALQVVAQTGDEDALLQQLAYAVIGLSDLVRSPDKLANRVPFFNRARGVDLEYGIGIDAGVRRVERDDLARLAFHRTSSLEGTASARIVSLHTSGDAVVPLWHQANVLARYEDSPLLIGVVRNDTPVHCGFSAEEIGAGWQTLRDWIANDAATPTLQTLDANCRAESAMPTCRFDPQSTQRAREAVPRLRGTLIDVLDRSLIPAGGLWTSATHPSQGLMIEELDRPLGTVPAGEQRYAVTWYTWAPAGDASPGPRWLAGMGRSVENLLYVDELVEVRGGDFATQLDPASLQFEPWGSLVFTKGRLYYDGRWGRGERDVAQTTTAGFGVHPSVDFSPVPPHDFGRSGTYYDPAHPGQGLVLNQFAPGGTVASLLLWYTFDPDGKPAWMYGVDTNAADGLAFAMTRAVRGGSFESGAAPAPPNHEPFGNVTLETDACHVTAIAWQSDVPGFGNGRVPLVRLTAPWLRYDFGSCRP